MIRCLKNNYLLLNVKLLIVRFPITTMPNNIHKDSPICVPYNTAYTNVYDIIP